MALGIEGMSLSQVKRIKAQSGEYGVKVGSLKEETNGLTFEDPNGVKVYIPNTAVQSVHDA
jgi:hypothetical protein